MKEHRNNVGCTNETKPLIIYELAFFNTQNITKFTASDLVSPDKEPCGLRNYEIIIIFYKINIYPSQVYEFFCTKKTLNK